MNGELDIVTVEDDDLEEIPGPVGTDDEKPRRVIVELDPRDGVLDRMDDVVVRDAVPSSRAVHLHTELA